MHKIKSYKLFERIKVIDDMCLEIKDICLEIEDAGGRVTIDKPSRFFLPAGADIIWENEELYRCIYIDNFYNKISLDELKDCLIRVQEYLGKYFKQLFLWFIKPSFDGSYVKSNKYKPTNNYIEINLNDSIELQDVKLILIIFKY